MNYTDRDNGALSINTRVFAPLERGDSTDHDSTVMAQDLLSRSLFSRLILWSADARRNRVLLTSHSAGVKPFYEGTLFQYLSYS